MLHVGWLSPYPGKDEADHLHVGEKLRASQEEKEQLKLLAKSGAGSESAGERGALEKDLTSQKESGGKRTEELRTAVSELPRELLEKELQRLQAVELEKHKWEAKEARWFKEKSGLVARNPCNWNTSGGEWSWK
uniref:Uncharacterized protein n=1 Tax=Amphimedon queenslandica TaxID=400682 RepID=A0A1X7SPP0_AMPQE